MFQRVVYRIVRTAVRGLCSQELFRSRNNTDRDGQRERERIPETEEKLKTRDRARYCSILLLYRAVLRDFAPFAERTPRTLKWVL